MITQPTPQVLEDAVLNYRIFPDQSSARLEQFVASGALSADHAMVYAVQKGDNAFVRWLLREQPHLDLNQLHAEEEPFWGDSFLRAAYLMEKLDTAMLLVDLGANSAEFVGLVIPDRKIGIDYKIELLSGILRKHPALLNAPIIDYLEFDHAIGFVEKKAIPLDWAARKQDHEMYIFLRDLGAKGTNQAEAYQNYLEIIEQPVYPCSPASSSIFAPVAWLASSSYGNVWPAQKIVGVYNTFLKRGGLVADVFYAVAMANSKDPKFSTTFVESVNSYNPIHTQAEVGYYYYSQFSSSVVVGNAYRDDNMPVINGLTLAHEYAHRLMHCLFKSLDPYAEEGQAQRFQEAEKATFSNIREYMEEACGYAGNMTHPKELLVENCENTSDATRISWMLLGGYAGGYPEEEYHAELIARFVQVVAARPKGEEAKNILAPLYEYWEGTINPVLSEYMQSHELQAGECAPIRPLSEMPHC